MNGSYLYSSIVLRQLIRQYKCEWYEAVYDGDTYYARICIEKIMEYEHDLPEVELMEKLESDLE